MKTVAVVSTKGGSGKTTVALNLAVAAWRRGRRTLIADIDPQRSAVTSWRARAADGPECVASSGGKLFQLQQAAGRGELDLLVVDTPGHVEGEIVEAVRIADLCVVVARPTFLDLAAAVQTLEILRRFDRQSLVVINQAPPRRLGQDAVLVSKAMAALRLAGLEPAPTALCARAPFQQSVGQGLGVEEWPGGEAAAVEVAAVWHTLDQRLRTLAAPQPRSAFVPARDYRTPNLAALV